MAKYFDKLLETAMLIGIVTLILTNAAGFGSAIGAIGRTYIGITKTFQGR
jgi:hypothetical protein